MISKFDPKANAVIIETRFYSEEQSRRTQAVLDTGASISIIPWELAEAIGYDPAISTNRRKVTTVSGTEIIPLIQVRTLEAFGKRAELLWVAVHDLPEQATVNALLGLNFLQRFDSFTLDFKKGEIRLE